MSKKIIKVAHDIAKGKIVIQHDLGINIIKSGIHLIDKSRNIPRSEVDAFKLKYDHWRDITSEILDEIFLSPNYSYKFRHQISSKKEYVNSSWQPDIKYYITKEIQPKIQYLKLLAENIMAYDEQAPEKENKVSDVAAPSNLELLSITQLIGLLKPTQLKSVVAATLAAFIAVFYFGYEVNSWKNDNDKYNLTTENSELKDENQQLKQELSSFKDKKDSIEE